METFEWTCPDCKETMHDWIDETGAPSIELYCGICDEPVQESRLSPKDLASWNYARAKANERRR